ncbi:MAG: N-acetylmuramic acid 6-phosphate etherase [Pirellulaceae bacterium]|nr:N-acetylmuramic acid 6-phosphate etherase [Pirellulaceae bacterium]
MNSGESQVPDRGHLLTEQRLEASQNLDAIGIDEALELINHQDAQIAMVVRSAIPSIADLAEVVVGAMRQGGRLIYAGAGTSGRLGILDASECPPTFHSPPNQVISLIAGGDAAIRHSAEGAEDDLHGAAAELDRLDVAASDVVVGVAAGGTTTYVLGAVQLARERGASTALICCVNQEDANPIRSESKVKREHGTTCPPSYPSAVDHLVRLPVGPEVLTGSTRMKAGTATKMVLNMLSTVVFVQLGKAWGNIMVDLRATNRKLADRAARILVQQCPGLVGSRQEALQLLERAKGHVKLALVMKNRNVDFETAQQLLKMHKGQLRPILGPPL